MLADCIHLPIMWPFEPQLTTPKEDLEAQGTHFSQPKVSSHSQHPDPISSQNILHSVGAKCTTEKEQALMPDLSSKDKKSFSDVTGRKRNGTYNRKGSKENPPKKIKILAENMTEPGEVRMAKFNSSSAPIHT